MRKLCVPERTRTPAKDGRVVAMDETEEPQCRLAAGWAALLVPEGSAGWSAWTVPRAVFPRPVGGSNPAVPVGDGSGHRSPNL